MPSLMFLMFALFPASETAAKPEISDFLWALDYVESRHNESAIGDGGASIGCLQISEACWRDSGLRGAWRWCLRRPYAWAVARAYMKRYEPRAYEKHDWEYLARLWSCGPQWSRPEVWDKGTSYWARVQKAMNDNTLRARRK